MNTRKIVQIAIDPSTDGYHFPEIYALCSDGTLWSRGDMPGVEWRQLPPIPHPTEPTTPTETSNG